MSHHYARLYAHQEYLTPGAAETTAAIAEAVRSRGMLGSASLVEVASGKGEAACTLAALGCRVLGIDPSPPFLRHAREKAAARGLGERVRFVRADGKRMPCPDGSFDGGYCMGAPSIVGLEPCLRELRRVVRDGGPVVVSDIYWHHVPEQPLGPEWLWLADEQLHPSLDEYRGVIEACGLRFKDVILHDLVAWEAYFAPIRVTAAEERARGESAFADEIEQGIDVERRGVDRFLGYATFVARRP